MLGKSRLLGAALAVVVAGAAWQWRQVGGNLEAADQSVFYGTVERREVRLSFPAAEHLAELWVEEGDLVEAGQVVARQHRARLLAQRQRAAAEVAAAEARAAAAAATHRRVAKLAQRGLAAREEADLAEAEARVAKAGVAAARAALAEIDQALADTELVAPVSGVVVERLAEVGDLVGPTTPVVRLALVEPVWVRAWVPEPLLGRIRPGLAAEIETDSFPGKRYPGWVGFVSPVAEFTPRHVETPELRTRLVYQIRVLACNDEGELRLGMPATVRILPREAQALGCGGAAKGGE
ncbi:MAG: hypothetical protein KatS3mg124_0054 [Porticoccaceae bacterium]|nr:MAG: hypothetical protein KatS3mg124_0054 [Porticoccaceae bacterium]